MANVLDIAKYILEREGELSTMKLQKLVYYAQVWSVVEDEAPLFPDVIKAWAQGPVVPALFQEHKGLPRVVAADIAGPGHGLTDKERARLDLTLDYYGARPARYLSELTHHELPWREAREKGERVGYSSPAIPLEAIRSFYSQRSPEALEEDYQMSVASKLMDEHAESLARLAQ